MLKTRLITAAILIPLVILGLFWAPYPYIKWAIAAITFACAWEWGTLFKFNPMEKGAWLISFFALESFPIWGQSSIKTLFGLAVLFWIIAALLVVTFKPGNHESSKAAGVVLGVFVLLPFMVGANLLVQVSPWILLTLFVLVWSADSFAYFGGKLFGSRKLIPKVSPNKTWEGIITALLGVWAVGMIVFYLGWLEKGPDWMQSPWKWWLMTTALFAATVFGDLFESLIKRIQNVKDTGKCLPGHGGVLDRLDSLFAGVPVLTYCLWM